MDIAPTDLDAVRRVFTGEMSLADAARHYTVRQSTLVGVAILQASGWTSAYKGEFGRLLEVLCQGSVGTEDWRLQGVEETDEDFYRRIFFHKDRYALIGASHRLGLHNSVRHGGDNLYLIPHAQLETLINENPRFRPWARSVFDLARTQLVEEREQAARQRQDDRKTLKAYRRALRKEFYLEDMPYVNDPRFARRVRDALDRVLNRFYPDADASEL